MKFFKITLPFILMCAVHVNLYAENYYVSISGDNANTGTKFAPFRNIQYAVSKLEAGDTIFIKSGIYNERIILNGVNGTENNYITLRNYPENTSVMIDGVHYITPENASVTIDGVNKKWDNRWEGLLHIYGSKYIQIKGLKLRNSYGAGFLVDNSEYIKIENSKTSDTFSSGIGVWGSSDITINNNEITKACSGGGEESITLSRTHYSDVSRNKITNNGSADGVQAGENGGEGIDVKEGSSYINVFENEVHNLNGRIGIYIDAWDQPTHDISVFNNVVHNIHNESGIALACELGGNGRLDDIFIYNNVVYSNDKRGIVIAGRANKAKGNKNSLRKMENIYIANNTLYKNLEGGIVLNNNDAKKVTIINNILSENAIAYTYPYQLYIEDHKNGYELIINKDVIDEREIHIEKNLVEINEGAEYFWAYHDLNLIGTPVFQNPESANFHLTSASLAIDAGVYTPIAIFDFDGIDRPVNGVTDIGAYEYH